MSKLKARKSTIAVDKKSASAKSKAAPRVLARPAHGKSSPHSAHAPHTPGSRHDASGNGRVHGDKPALDTQAAANALGVMKSQSGADLTEKIKELLRLAQEQG